MNTETNIILCSRCMCAVLFKIRIWWWITDKIVCVYQIETNPIQSWINDDDRAITTASTPTSAVTKNNWWQKINPAATKSYKMKWNSISTLLSVSAHAKPEYPTNWERMKKKTEKHKICRFSISNQIRSRIIQENKLEYEKKREQTKMRTIGTKREEEEKKSIAQSIWKFHLLVVVVFF